MARTGGFGRLPRTAPDLSSTIVSMLREFQNMQDHNIENAWKNGGLFNGKKVTDKMLLDHWKERRDQVSKDDPMWDYYNNMMLNLDFSIEESKMGLKYAQHKVGEGGMAAFYKKWAEKSPTDSEVYRNLMTKAAQFLDAAASRARGSAARASNDAYIAAQKNLESRYANFDSQQSIVEFVAKDMGILTGSETLMDMNVDQNDPTRITAIFDAIYSDPRYAGIAADLTKANGGKPQTYEGFLSDHKIKINTLDDQIALAKKKGDNATVKALTKTKVGLTRQRTYLGDQDEMDEYAQYHQQFADIAGAQPPVPPWVLRQAAADYANALESLRARTQDPDLAGKLNNEIGALRDGKVYGPTAFDTSLTTGKPTGQSDAKDTAETIKGINDQFASLDAGYVWTKDDKGRWSTIPTTTPSGASALDPSKGVVIPYITDDGEVVMIFAPTQIVNSEAVNPVNNQGATGAVPISGQAVNPAPGTSTFLGRAYENPVTGERKMSIVNADGKETWYANNPLNPGVRLIPDGSGNLVATIPTSEKQYDPQTYVTGQPNQPGTAAIISFTYTAPGFEGIRSDGEPDPSITEMLNSPNQRQLLAQTGIVDKVRAAYIKMTGQPPELFVDPATGAPIDPPGFDSGSWGEAAAISRTIVSASTPDAEGALLRSRAARRSGVNVWSGDVYTLDDMRAAAKTVRDIQRFDRIESGQEKRMGIERSDRLRNGDVNLKQLPDGTWATDDIRDPEVYRSAIIRQMEVAQASLNMRGLSARPVVSPSGTNRFEPGTNKFDQAIEKAKTLPTIQLPSFATGMGVALPDYLKPQNVARSAVPVPFEMWQDATARGVALSPVGRPLPPKPVVSPKPPEPVKTQAPSVRAQYKPTKPKSYRTDDTAYRGNSSTTPVAL